MRIAVFGTGAIGGYFGGRLAQAGEDVVFIARGEHLQTMLMHGLRVDSISGNSSKYTGCSMGQVLICGLVGWCGRGDTGTNQGDAQRPRNTSDFGTGDA